MADAAHAVQEAVPRTHISHHLTPQHSRAEQFNTHRVWTTVVSNTDEVIGEDDDDEDAMWSGHWTHGGPQHTGTSYRDIEIETDIPSAPGSIITRGVS